jgi:uncharacterized membrane protein
MQAKKKNSSNINNNNNSHSVGPPVPQKKKNLVCIFLLWRKERKGDGVKNKTLNGQHFSNNSKKTSTHAQKKEAIGKKKRIEQLLGETKRKQKKIETEV